MILGFHAEKLLKAISAQQKQSVTLIVTEKQLSNCGRRIEVIHVSIKFRGNAEIDNILLFVEKRICNWNKYRKWRWCQWIKRNTFKPYICAEASNCLNFDDNLQIHQNVEGENYDQILENIILDEISSEEDVNTLMDIDEPLINTTEVLQMLQKIRKWVYLMQPEIYSKLSGIFDSIFAKLINKNTYQNTIEAYFN